MNGLNFTMLERYVVSTAGSTALSRSLADAGFADAEPWVSCGTYPDGDLFAWMRVIAAAQQQAIDDFERNFARWAVPRLLTRFHSLVAGFESPMALIANISGSIYPHLRRIMPGYSSALRGFRQIDAQTLVIEAGPMLWSCSTIEGMLQGLGDHFGMPASLQHPLCCRSGQGRCEIQVRFAAGTAL